MGDDEVTEVSQTGKSLLQIIGVREIDVDGYLDSNSSMLSLKHANHVKRPWGYLSGPLRTLFFPPHSRNLPLPPLYW